MMGLSPSRTGLLAQTFWRPPGSRAHCLLTCLDSSTTPGPAATRDLTRLADVAFPLTEKGRHPVACFRSSMILPASPLSTLRCHPSRDHRQDSRPEWSRFSFSVGLSHPLQCAGLSRRSLSRVSRLSRVSPASPAFPRVSSVPRLLAGCRRNHFLLPFAAICCASPSSDADILRRKFYLRQAVRPSPYYSSPYYSSPYYSSPYYSLSPPFVDPTGSRGFEDLANLIHIKNGMLGLCNRVSCGTPVDLLGWRS